MTQLTMDVASTDPVVALAASGDRAAFTQLVERHHAAMVQVAYAITGDLDTARDAAQSAWSIALRRLGTLRGHGQLRAWLATIAANEARQALRKGRVRIVVDISETIDLPAGGDPADQIPTIDLTRALSHLGPDDRTLLALRFVAGLDSNEIAGQLGMSASGVRSRLARLIDRLRKELDHV